LGFTKYFPEVFKEFRCMSVFELLKEYIETGRIKLDKSKFEGKKITIHDPCNYHRKSYKAFGQHFLDECRWVTAQCGPEIVEMEPHGMNGLCCGAGGGAWAMPYVQERLDYGKWKADQIKATGADLICAPCHNCRDQIMKALTKEYDLPQRTYYIWELVSDCLVFEPWSEEEVKKSHEERDKQYERDGVDLEEEAY
jgi:Fe-S oxidoreductase